METKFPWNSPSSNPMLTTGSLKKFNTQGFNNQEETQALPMLLALSQAMVQAEEVQAATQEWVEVEQRVGIHRHHQELVEATLQV